MTPATGRVWLQNKWFELIGYTNRVQSCSADKLDIFCVFVRGGERRRKGGKERIWDAPGISVLHQMSRTHSPVVNSGARVTRTHQWSLPAWTGLTAIAQTHWVRWTASERLTMRWERWERLLVEFALHIRGKTCLCWAQIPMPLYLITPDRKSSAAVWS